jgi:hypothetical protein
VGRHGVDSPTAPLHELAEGPEPTDVCGWYAVLMAHKRLGVERALSNDAGISVGAEGLEPPTFPLQGGTKVQVQSVMCACAARRVETRACHEDLRWRVCRSQGDSHRQFVGSLPSL